jgi:hypothetical protein
MGVFGGGGCKVGVDKEVTLLVFCGVIIVYIFLLPSTNTLSSGVFSVNTCASIVVT